MYVCMLHGLVCFFFKQKTAYEMRISDWSSDVCSSDLPDAPGLVRLRMRRSGISVRSAVTCTMAAVDPSSRSSTTTISAGARSEERRVGKGVSVRVDLGGRRNIKKKITIATSTI